MTTNNNQWPPMTTNEDQPGEVHRAAHLPPVHLQTLVAIDQDFQNSTLRRTMEWRQDKNDNNCDNNVNDNNDDNDKKTLRSPMRVETK